MKLGIGKSLALAAGLLGSVSHRYQRVRPVTQKNIGRNWVKSRSLYWPHQGERECARRRRQMAKGEAQ